MKQFYTYLHCRPDGMPFYVGKGHDSRRRKRSHEFKSDRNQYYQNIIAKHGAENIVIWKLDCDSEQAAFTLEKYLIAHYRRIGAKLCNLTDGGEGPSGYIQSEETRTKRSLSHKGKKASAETKAKLSAAKMGHSFSDEAIKKMSIAAKLRGNNRKGKGYKHSEAAKAKMSIARKLYYLNKKGDLP